MLSAILLVSACGLVQGLSAENPIVSTNVGLIQGNVTEDGYTTFLGIPYAVVNASNPFGPSTSHPGFNDTFEAYEATACPQVYNDVATGTIDCLTLNINVPSTANSTNSTAGNLLPVMVYIFGGAFAMGSAKPDDGPKFLLQHDVIVVGINFRVGVYGFMCLDIPEVAGNQGLKDQVLALRWINENIEAFGGDPQQITVFGHSSGAMSVNLHLLSSNEELFQKAILMSGSALSPWVIRDVNNNIPLQLAAAFDYNTTDVLDAVEYLSTIDELTLVQKAYDLKITTTTGHDNPIISPCIEKNTTGVEHFLTEHPKYMKSAKVITTPIMIGDTSDELAFQYETADAEFFENYSFDELNLSFDFGDKEEEAKARMKHFYIGDKDPGKDVKDELIDFISDFVFNYPTINMAKRFLEIGAENVYGYSFAYSGDRNYMKKSLNLNITGATHADELGYLFDMKMFNGTPSSQDQLMIDRISTLWTNFAKYGDPTPEISELLPVKCEPITNTTLPYLLMGSNLTLASRPYQQRMGFWELFYEDYETNQKW